MHKTVQQIAVMLILSILFSTTLVNAQEATTQPTNGTIVCDADLIVSLTTAEQFFGFSQILSLITNPDPALMADVSTLDKGQYTPLFTDSANDLPIISMSQEQMQGIADMMQLDATALQAQLTTMMPAGTDTTTMTSLSTSSIADEDPTCGVLRVELNRFYTILNFQRSQSLTNAAETIPTTPNGAVANATVPAPTVVPGSAIGTNNTSGSSDTGNGGASSSGTIPGTGAQNTPAAGGTSPGG